MNKRPPTITVPAVLFLIFEIFAVFGILSSGAMLLLGDKVKGVMANPAIAAMNESPEYALYLKIMLPLAVIMAGMGIAIAIGLFKGKEWARKGGIWLSIFKTVNNGVATWMTVIYVNPAMEKYMAATISKAGQGKEVPMIQSTMKIAMMAGAIGGALFWVAVAVTMVILLTRPSSVAFCRGEAAQSEPPPLSS